MNLLETYRRWRTYRRAVEDLKQLSDRNLADIGIDRGEIHGVVRRGR